MVEQPNRFIKWDYDNNLAIEYERGGECNGCGACCKAMIRFRASARKELSHDQRYENDPSPLDGLPATTQEGTWYEADVDGKRRFWQFIEITPDVLRCPALTADHKCSVHFDKNAICSTWPFAPEHVTPFPDCSYTFTEVARWEIEP